MFYQQEDRKMFMKVLNDCYRNFKSLTPKASRSRPESLISLVICRLIQSIEMDWIRISNCQPGTYYTIGTHSTSKYLNEIILKPMSIISKTVMSFHDGKDVIIVAMLNITMFASIYSLQRVNFRL